MADEAEIPLRKENRPIMGLANGPAKEPPLSAINPEFLFPEQRTLDDKTQEMMGNSLQRLSGPEEGYRDELMTGVRDSGQGLLPTVSSGVNPQGGPVNIGLNEALNRRAQRGFETTGRALERTAGLQAKTDRADQAAQLSSQMGRFEQLKIRNYQYRMSKLEQAKQLHAQEQAERGALIGSIVGVVGTVIGGAIGGPIGAGVGGGLGQAAGKGAA